MGASVIVTEIDPTHALEALMEGYRVMPLVEAARIGDVFVTVTGNRSVIGADHFAVMKDGAIVANSGHFNVEIDIPSLESIAVSTREVRPFVQEYLTADGRRLHLLGEGPAHQPGGRRGPSRRRDGHELCQSGVVRGTHGHARCVVGAARVHCAGGD